MSGATIGAKQTVDLETTARQQILTLLGSIPSLLSCSYEEEHSLVQSLAEKTEDYSDHTTYKLVSDQLGKSKSRILKDISIGFSAALKADEQAQTLGNEQALNFHTDNLSIVTDKEMVYQLKLESGFSESQNNFDGAKVQSGWKFCESARKSDIHRKLDSVRPGFLALILQDSIDSNIEDKKLARIIYRFIGGNFFHQLSKHYHHLTPVLSDLADSLNRKQKELEEQEDKPNPFTSSDLPQADVNEVNSANDLQKAAAGTNVDVTGLIRNWDVPIHLNNTKTSSDFDGFSNISLEDLSPDTQIATASIEDVIKALGSLTEKGRDSVEIPLNTQDIRSALKQSLSQLSEEGILTVIDKVSENAINLVSHLFENLNKDGLLIDEVVHQISRTQAPVMQVALTDSKLFQTNEHPVRKYLNAVGDLGIRISDSSEEGFLEMRDSITDLLKNFNGDLEIFESAEHELCDYIESSIYSVKHRDGEYEATEHDSSVKFTAIRDYLDSQSQMLKNELDFHKMIKYVWGAILSKVIRRHGTGSEAWESATDIYSSALWSTQVNANNDGKREILRRLPKIVQGVRALFEDYGLETRIRDAILDQMIQIHLQIMRGKDGREIEENETVSIDLFRCFKGQILSETESEHTAEFDAMELNESEKVIEPLRNVFSRFDAISPFEMEEKILTKTEVDWGELSDEDEHMIANIRDKNAPGTAICQDKLSSIFETLNRLPVETIFTFQEGDQQVRYRLADKSIVLGKFTFKSFEGDITLIKTKGDLALDISRGDAAILLDKGLFEDALETVVSQIQAHP